VGAFGEESVITATKILPTVKALKAVEVAGCDDI